MSPVAYSIEVVTHASAGETSLTKSQLRRIYSMRQLRWTNGETIVVFTLPSSHPLHQQFSKELLRIFPYQLDRIWNKLTYSGVGSPPIIVETPQALLEAVAKTPGAIGYGEGIKENSNVLVIKIKG